MLYCSITPAVVICYTAAPSPSTLRECLHHAFDAYHAGPSYKAQGRSGSRWLTNVVNGHRAGELIMFLQIHRGKGRDFNAGAL